MYNVAEKTHRTIVVLFCIHDFYALLLRRNRPFVFSSVFILKIQTLISHLNKQVETIETTIYRNRNNGNVINAGYFRLAK